MRTKAIGNAAFVVMLIGSLVGGLTQTAMNTTLPSVTVDLGISVALSQWLTTIYPLAMGITMPVTAYLSRRFSTRKLYVTSLGLFLVGTVIICLSDSFPFILAGRLMEGVATGICMPLIQIVVLTQFPRSRVGFLMGCVGLAMGFAPSIGPTIAGAFTTTFGWRSCFVFLSLFSAVVLLLSWLFIGANKELDRRAGSLDYPSLLLSSLGFGGLLLGCSNAASVGWTDPLTIVSLAAGAVLLAVFTHRELHIDNPLLSMRVFRTRDFTVSTIMICCLFISFIGVTLVIPLHVQDVLGRTALESGMVLLPGTISAAIISPLSGWLMDKLGARPIAILGSAVFLVGSVAIINMGEISSLVYLSCWQFVRTVGQSILIMPITTWGLNCLPTAIAADGTSVTNTLRQVAASLGTALMVFFLADGASGAITPAGVDAAMLFSVVVAAILFALAVIFVRKADTTD